MADSVVDNLELTVRDATEEDLPTDRIHTKAHEAIAARDDFNPGYDIHSPTDSQILATLSIKAARKLYGTEISDKATLDELQTCIQKNVWEYLAPDYVTTNAIPSRMFLTPKSLPNGKLDRIKGRIVAGGHRQDRSLYEDSEISSPTVALTSVLAMAALAAKLGHFVMTLDHKAAYLNAQMKGAPVEMLLSPEVAEILCGIDLKYCQYLRPDKKIAVRLKKALYGCVQSAVLWYNELTSTLEGLGYKRNPYDTCSFTRMNNGSLDRILVYVDEDSLKAVAEVLKAKYDAVTSQLRSCA